MLSLMCMGVRADAPDARPADRPGTDGITFAPHRGTCICKRCCRLHIEVDARQAETTKAGSTQKERSKELCITIYDAPSA